nr:EamA/RhaT family transporter [uncultured Kingella sp.]
MPYLIAAVLASVAVSILLKIARQRGIGIAQAVALNYPVAALLAWLLLEPDLSQWHKTLLPDAWLFALLGVLFPTVFVVMGRAVEQAGIAKSDAAQRLSLFLPVLAAFALFGEPLAANRAAGLVLAFAALACLLAKPSGQPFSGSLKTQMPYLAAVWLGYGLIDILLKQLSKSANMGTKLFAIFVLASVLMAVYLAVKRTHWTSADVAGGILLGCLNFANILFYLKAHRAFGSNPTIVFAGMNMGVIALGTLVGAAVFKERLSALNITGIMLALAAVLCLFYGAAWF